MCKVNHLKVYELGYIVDAYKKSRHSGRRVTEELAEVMAHAWNGPRPHEHITNEDIVAVITAHALEEAIFESPDQEEYFEYASTGLSLDAPAANRDGDQVPCHKV
jgi:hypothetical protein